MIDTLPRIVRRFSANRRVLLSLLLLLLVPITFISDCIPARARNNLSTREQRRRLIPLDKLKVFLEAPERIRTMQPRRVLDVFGVMPGEAVADIGAGTGFFSFPLAHRVGDAGTVYAVEIENELLDFIRRKMKTQNVTNIIPVKSSETSPNLSPDCCDRILIVNTYIYFDQPVAFMKNLRPAVKPGGLVGIIEVDAEQQERTRKKFLLGTEGRAAGEVVEEMKRAGFVLRESHDFLESRFFLIFSPAPAR